MKINLDVINLIINKMFLFLLKYFNFNIFTYNMFVNFKLKGILADDKELDKEIQVNLKC